MSVWVVTCLDKDEVRVVGTYSTWDVAFRTVMSEVIDMIVDETEAHLLEKSSVMEKSSKKRRNEIRKSEIFTRPRVPKNKAEFEELVRHPLNQFLKSFDFQDGYIIENSDLEKNVNTALQTYTGSRFFIQESKHYY